MQKMDSKIQSKELYKAFEWMRKKKLEEAEKCLQKGLEEAKAVKDLVLEGLYYSAYGVLYKIKKDFRQAWKYYERAEKLIPDDPALKIISSQLLIDYFGQYDTAIRKMEKVIKQVGKDVIFLHQAYTIQGLGYLKKGDKKKALEALKKSIGDDFKGLQTVANIDFRLMQEMAKKKTALDTCRLFLEKALAFAKGTKEKQNQKILEKMLEGFPKK